MLRALLLGVPLSPARGSSVPGKSLRSDIVLMVFWITADCDLHHILQ
jgi:hypothetical protein